MQDVGKEYGTSQLEDLIREEAREAANVAAECDTATLLLMALEDRLSLAHCTPEDVSSEYSPDAMLRANIADLCVELATQQLLKEATE